MPSSPRPVVQPAKNHRKPLKSTFTREDVREQMVRRLEEVRKPKKEQIVYMYREGIPRELFQLAEDAIRYTRQVLWRGAANQTKNLDKLGTGPSRLLEFSRWALKQIKPINAREEIAIQAAIAEDLGTGHCDEFASVTFMYLWAKKPPNIIITKYGEEAQDHCFVTVQYNDRSQGQSDAVVVADAWPMCPYPVTTNSFWVRAGTQTTKTLFKGESDGVDYKKIASSKLSNTKGYTEKRDDLMTNLPERSETDIFWTKVMDSFQPHPRYWDRESTALEGTAPYPKDKIPK